MAEKYRKVRRTEEKLPDNEIRVKSLRQGFRGGRNQNRKGIGGYLARAHELLTIKQDEVVIIKGVKDAIETAIQLAELVRHRVKGLYQVVRITTTRFQDTYEPLEEGLDTLNFERVETSVEIALSRDKSKLNLKQGETCQDPLPDDEVMEYSTREGGERRGGRGGRGGLRAGFRGRGGFRERRERDYSEGRPRSRSGPREGGYRENREGGYRKPFTNRYEGGYDDDRQRRPYRGGRGGRGRGGFQDNPRRDDFQEGHDHEGDAVYERPPRRQYDRPRSNYDDRPPRVFDDRVERGGRGGRGGFRTYRDRDDVGFREDGGYRGRGDGGFRPRGRGDRDFHPRGRGGYDKPFNNRGGYRDGPRRGGQRGNFGERRD